MQIKAIRERRVMLITADFFRASVSEETIIHNRSFFFCFFIFITFY